MCLNLTNRAAKGRERSEFIIPAREPRVVLGNCKIGCPIFLSFFLWIYRLVFCQWRHGAFCVSGKVYDRWITSNFRANDTEQQAQNVAWNPRRRGFSIETPLENADQNSSRAEKTTTTRKRRSRESIASIAKATSSTQRPQHVQRQRQNITITLQMKPMKKGDTDFRRFKKRWGDQATLEVYCQNYLLQCNGRQQQLHDLYARTEDSRQPLHHEQQWFFIVLSFISLQWTVYNTDNVWHVGERYICK